MNKGGCNYEAMPVLPQFEEYILHNIFGRRKIANKTKSISLQGPVRLSEYLFKSMPVVETYGFEYFLIL
jgi:hypothetical protein